MQAKYIFKVVSPGINFPLGDVNIMVPKTLAKTAKLSWSISGLEIHTVGTSFIVAYDGLEIVCNDYIMIPWHEAVICLIKDDRIFAEISMALTTDECEWREFKTHIANEAECFVAEIYELNSKLHKCTSTSSNVIESHRILTSSISTLEKHYKEGRVNQKLYNVMISKWKYLKYLVSCRISASTKLLEEVSDIVMQDVIAFTFNYTKSNL